MHAGGCVQRRRVPGQQGYQGARAQTMLLRLTCMYQGFCCWQMYCIIAT
jgi:hypothetical protein